MLFDADMLVYQMCAIAETEIEWERDLWTLHSDANEVKAALDDKVQAITNLVLDHLNYEGAYEILMCFSCDEGNFRQTQVLSTYKLNRQGKRKPLAYYGVKKWVKENYNCYQKDTLEADDCIGILATLNPNNAVIISGDKDFKTIPCFCLYNYGKHEFSKVTEEEADYNFYKQTLTGDTADGYGGCKGIGAVGAAKILDKECSWGVVLQAFVKAGYSPEQALQQARCARILRKTDYDFKNKKAKLWQPS